MAVALELYRNGYAAPVAYGIRRHFAAGRYWEPDLIG